MQLAFVMKLVPVPVHQVWQPSKGFVFHKSFWVFLFPGLVGNIGRKNPQGEWMRAHPRQGTQITATLARASLCSCCEEVCTAEAKVVIMWGSGRIITPLRIRHALPQNFNEMARLSNDENGEQSQEEKKSCLNTTDSCFFFNHFLDALAIDVIHRVRGRWQDTV